MQAAISTPTDAETSREKRGVATASRGFVASDFVSNETAEDSCSVVADILMAPFVAANPNQGAAAPVRFETTVPIALSTPVAMVV